MWCSCLWTQGSRNRGCRRVTEGLRLVWATMRDFVSKNKNKSQRQKLNNLPCNKTKTCFRWSSWKIKHSQAEWSAGSGSFRVKFVLFTNWGECSLHRGTQTWMGEAQTLGCFSASQSSFVSRALYLEWFFFFDEYVKKAYYVFAM